MALTGKTGCFRAVALLVALVLAFPVASASRADLERQFRAWLDQEIWPEARSRGVAAGTFRQALAGVTVDWDLPGLVAPGADDARRKQHQAEFRAPAAYFQPIGGIVSGGRARSKRHSSILAAIERDWNVPGGILLAIWGRESAFGAAEIQHDAFRVLATRAFMSARKDMFRAELLAGLEMVERGHVARENMKASWAGALGQPQFLPTSYLAHAVDGDGDGHADIWRSVPDTLASIARYLRNHGWKSGRDWGFEVDLPHHVSCALEGPDGTRPIAEWMAMGVRRVGGRAFPPHEMPETGSLLLPAGRSGPAFIVTPNFYVLKAYNESDLYALFVGHAADRIMYADRGFYRGWDRVDSLNRSDIAALQRALERQGHDVGGVDGLAGFKTRRSIGAWQTASGLAPTCFPSTELVGRLR